MSVINVDEFEGFRISVSALRDFIHCQWKYALTNVLKIERKRKNSNLAFGSAFHEGSEPIWNGKAHKFEAAWLKFAKDKSVEYKSSESWHSLKVKGTRMTDALETAVDGKVLSGSLVELSDPVMVDKHLVTRRLDFVGEVKNLSAIIDGKEKKLNGQVILDLKSASRKYGLLDGQSSLQLRGYMLPLNSQPNVKPKHAAFVVVTKAANPQVQIIGTKVNETAIADFKRNVKIAAAQVSLKKFSKNMGNHCNWCDFYECCYRTTPDWQALYKKREPHRNENNPQR